MKIIMKYRYLAFPVSYAAQEKQVLFYSDDKLVLDLVIRLDQCCPDTFEYMDMGRFLGETLTVKTQPDMTFDIKQTDEIENDGLYKEKYRPVAHFSASRGWINDPNGLVWVDGQYHMFFQYNPVGRDWGNMHWGHAVSTDLLHWKEKDIALFPDEMGTMFSGCGIVDTNNVTGLKENDHDVILLFYTAAGGTSAISENQPFTQCMAYSSDGGLTFNKYKGNPLIKNETGGNRDPKVIYVEECGCYYLALYLEENQYALYVSKNLLTWKRKQELTLPEDLECPDLYPLYLDDGEEKYWAFSGASDHYLIGQFHSDGIFRPVQPVKRLHYGTNSYASQTFSGVADGRILRVVWNTSRIPESPFNCAMCIPTQMKLKTVRDEIRLCSMPVREVESIYTKQTKDSCTVLKSDKSMCYLLYGKAQDIKLRIVCENKASIHLSLLGVNVDIMLSENSLKCKDSTMPLFADDNEITLRIITDTNALEIFVNKGEAFLCVEHAADYNLNKMVLSAEGDDVLIKEVAIAELSSIWYGAENEVGI